MYKRYMYYVMSKISITLENLIKEIIALTLDWKGDYFFFMTVITSVITEIITILN